MHHLFSVEGWIQEGSPWLSVKVSYIPGETIEEAITAFRAHFNKPVTVTDVTRILTNEKQPTG